MKKEDSLTGKIIGGYLLEEIIGEGATGAVYIASDRELNTKFAIKIVHVNGVSREEDLIRFRREAHFGSLLQHPNIVRVYKSEESDHCFYLVMEYQTGQTLENIINLKKNIPAGQCCDIAYQTTLALKAAHAHGIVHRDVKPSNIIISEDGKVKLTDFGLAITINTPGILASPGQIVGTIFYMSPEQAMGKADIDARADFYSLGITLFHALAGKVPYIGRTPMQVLQQHISAPIPSLRNFLPSISPVLENLIKRLMSKQAQDRFANADELLQEITICRNSLAIGSLNSSDAKTWRRIFVTRWHLAVFGLLAVILVIIGISKKKSQEIALLLRQQQYDKSRQMFENGTQDANFQEPGVRHLVALKIFPERAMLTPHEKIQFQVKGYDEVQREITTIVPDWVVLGGVIDKGIYTAGEKPGSYVVAVRDKNTWLEAQAIIHIDIDHDKSPFTTESIMEQNFDPSLGWFGEKISTGFKRSSQPGEYIWEKDASRMVYVPEGYFWMGNVRGNSEERPLRKVYLSAYYIDKYELTWQQYYQFCDATGHARPPLPEYEINIQHPVVNISWEDAQEYAIWAQKKLPTEAQWEKAARGGFKIPNWERRQFSIDLIANIYPRRSYPWGEHLPHAEQKFYCNYVAHDHWQKRGEDGYTYTAPVGMFDDGKSPYQCMDMAGNVWEWCDDSYDPIFYEKSQTINPANLDPTLSVKVLRGGSWFNFAESCRTTKRYNAPHRARCPWIGIRLVRTCADTPSDQNENGN